MTQQPEIITKLENQFLEVISKDDNPSISIDEAAKLLGQDKECLRVAIARGTCPFGYGGQNERGSRFGKVSKLALYNFFYRK